MAASTITRDSWTNDTGTAAVPNADGTLLTNTVLQNNIYARVDAMFAGAGTYTTFTFGGIVSAEGFGAHTFSAGGTGGNEIRLRNTTAGTTMYAGLGLGNDAAASVGVLTVQSSTYTTSAFNLQDGMTLGHTRAGGISIVATHASGMVRFYTGGSSERMRLDTAGHLFIGDTSNADITGPGITILNVSDLDVIALKGSDVTHGLTSYETDTFGMISQYQANTGGLKILGLAESASNTGLALTANLAGNGSSTRSTLGQAAVMIQGMENNTVMDADINVLAIATGTTTRFIFDSDGDSHQDVGTAWTNFDDHDDIALLHALSAGVSRMDDPLREGFGMFLEQHRDTLTKNKIVTFNEDGHHFINWSRTHMLMVGAVRQLGMKLATLEAKLLEAAS